MPLIISPPFAFIWYEQNWDVVCPAPLVLFVDLRPFLRSLVRWLSSIDRAHAKYYISASVRMQIISWRPCSGRQQSDTL